MMILIRDMSAQDYAEIIEINRSCQPAVAGLDHDELQRFQSLGGLLLVAEIDSAIVGYLVAFNRAALYDGEEFQQFLRLLPQDFLYIDQIAVAPSFWRRGMGCELYNTAFQRAKKDGTGSFCCEVNLVPPNPQSMDFHRRIGFKAVAEISLNDGRTVALLVK